MSINPFDDYPLSWRPNKRELKRPYVLNLVKQMKKDINSGLLLPGTKLPPQRELADFLDLSFSTMTRVYKLSQEQGLTYGRVGQGTFIAGHVNSPLTISRNSTENMMDLGFIASFESTNRFTKRTIQEVLKETQINRLLNYDSPTGLDHQKLVATRYLKTVGMNVNQQNTIIASGGENAISIALASLFNNGDRIAVDEFTYSNFIDLARLFGLKLVPIYGDDKGMLPNKLDLACEQQRIAGIYLMPDCNNPTIVTMPNERREELAKVIKKNHLILLEDDYLSFLNIYRQHPLRKMSTLLPDQSVYIASMSKPMVSGLRVSFVRPANQYVKEFNQAMFAMNVKTSSLDAEIITKLLKSEQSSKIMQEKIRLMGQNTRIFDEVFQTTHPDSSFFLPLFLKSHERGQIIEKKLLNNGIRVFHSDRFLTGGRGKYNFLRISLAAIDDGKEMRKALIKLKQVLKKYNWI
jgi:DNA-binding transcriptional MocR family regulator